MKKVLSVVAMALMIVGLTGCMDSPDAGNKRMDGGDHKMQNK